MLPQRADHGSVQVHCAPPQVPTSQACRETSPESSAREHLQHRLERESDLDIRNTVEGLLSVFPERHPDATVDRKGKGMAREAPVQSTLGPSSVAQASTSNIPTTAPTASSSSQPATSTTLKEAFQWRLQNEEDPEVKESLIHLFTTLYGAPNATTVSEPAAPVQGTSEQVEDPVKEATAAGSSQVTTSFSLPLYPEAHSTPQNNAKAPASEPHAPSDTDLHRSRRARRSSLGAIKEIEDALHALEDAFVFPTQLDFSPDRRGRSAENGLMYTSNNRAVHAYEDALNGLLERLDAVDSQGDTAIRGRRKEVVREVERALRDIERRVEESRERSRERGSAESAAEARHVSFSVPIMDATPQTDASPATTKDSDVPTAALTAVESSATKDTPAAPVEETAEAQVAPAPTVEEASQTQESQTQGAPADEAAPTPIQVTEVTSTLSPATENQAAPETHTEAVPAPVVDEQEGPLALETTGAATQGTSRPEASSTIEAAESQHEQADLALEAPSASTDAAGASATSAVPEPQLTSPSPDTTDFSHSAHPDATTDASSPIGSCAASESGSDAFLLSSHPLQDPTSKANAETTTVQEGEEPVIVTHAEAEGDNSSEWSEVEA